ANALVGKLQKECACDAVGFGHYMRTRFLDWQSWERYNWPEQFPKAKIEVSVRVFIRRSGMTFQSPVGR
ncbi:MAG TPA: Ger(x)C family spore germination C-terminal domain-containing protein, partial [Symbiobacteriaceae bacterium]|nr:Ger(x)C family spore germination C-terminal domain-containing protein [Symbiobacteriaceae bacterium]